MKVMLCGEGADELFGGYSRYRSAGARRVRPPPAQRRRVRARSPRRRSRLARRLGAAEAEAGPGRSPLQRLQAVDIAEWLPNDLLVKLDRCLMAHGVEGRTPFLDPVVADFAFRLPDGPRFAAASASCCCATGWPARSRPPAFRPQERLQPAGRRLDRGRGRPARRPGRRPARRGRVNARRAVRAAFAAAATTPAGLEPRLLRPLAHQARAGRHRRRRYRRCVGSRGARRLKLGTCTT